MKAEDNPGISCNACGQGAWAAAHVYAYSNEPERMLACLEVASERHLWHLRVDPVFDAYRVDEGFAASLARTGFGDSMNADAFAD